MTQANLKSTLKSAFGNVQRINHQIQADIEGIFDPETAIAEYFVAAGTDEGEGKEAHVQFRSAGTSEGSLLLGGLSLPDGDVVVTVRAVNNAFESGEVHLRMRIDSTPYPRRASNSGLGLLSFT